MTPIFGHLEATYRHQARQERSRCGYTGIESQNTAKMRRQYARFRIACARLRFHTASSDWSRWRCGKHETGVAGVGGPPAVATPQEDSPEKKDRSNIVAICCV